MLATLGEAYKVQMLAGYKPTAVELFHMATRGNAERLHIGHETGAIEIGKYADLVVLDPRATPVLASRQDLSTSLEDVLFSLMILGDDRAIRATYVAGRKVHERVTRKTEDEVVRQPHFLEIVARPFAVDDEEAAVGIMHQQRMVPDVAGIVDALLPAGGEGAVACEVIAHRRTPAPAMAGPAAE